MAKQTFTAGQVLTAAQMTSLQENDYNWSTNAQTASYTLVAADAGKTVTMTNAGATTITVNTGLFTAGDRVSIINLGAGACTITAGTATVNTAGLLVLPQYGSGTLWFSSASASIFIPDDRNSGLTLITAQTIGSAVSSVTVSNVFSSTYDNYRIIISGGVASGNVSLLWTMGATTTGYYSALNGRSWANAAVTSGTANGASWSCGEATTNQISAVVDLCTPFLSDETSFVSLQNGNGTTGYTYQAGGYLANTTSYTSFTVAPTTGTLTGGTIRVYGYQNS